MKLIVAGSRDYNDEAFLYSKLNEVYYTYSELCNIDCIIVGGCRGVDTIAKQWALDLYIPVKEYPADWEKYGKGAGPRRNEEMAKIATHLIAFKSSKSTGTQNMITLANKYNLWVKIINV